MATTNFSMVDAYCTDTRLDCRNTTVALGWSTSCRPRPLLVVMLRATLVYVRDLCHRRWVLFFYSVRQGDCKIVLPCSEPRVPTYLVWSQFRVRDAHNFINSPDNKTLFRYFTAHCNHRRVRCLGHMGRGCAIGNRYDYCCNHCNYYRDFWQPETLRIKLWCIRQLIYESTMSWHHLR